MIQVVSPKFDINQKVWLIYEVKPLKERLVAFRSTLKRITNRVTCIISLMLMLTLKRISI